MKQSIALVLGALLLNAPICAMAGGVFFSSGTTPAHWHASLVPYKVNPAGSADISDGSDLASIHESFSDWDTLECVVSSMPPIWERAAQSICLPTEEPTKTTKSHG